MKNNNVHKSTWEKREQGSDASDALKVDKFKFPSIVATPSAPQVARDSDVALWRQITDGMEDEIKTGSLPSGARLPTEAELANRYGVNRHTLRRALAELRRKGLVHASPRRGTFVAKQRIPYTINHSTRFSDNVTRAGREASGRVLSCVVTKAPEAMADWLSIARAGKVVEMRHIRLANDIPIGLATTWLPADRFARIAQIYEHAGSLSKALARMGMKTYLRKESRIAAHVATAEDQDILGLSRGDLVLQLDCMDVDHLDEPISASRTRFATDRIDLQVDH